MVHFSKEIQEAIELGRKEREDEIIETICRFEFRCCDTLTECYKMIDLKETLIEQIKEEQKQ